MLQIRPEQMLAFEAERIRLLEEAAVAHVREFFAGECANAGAAAVRDAIRSGIRRAREHGFETTREILKFISLMFVFGRGFDCDGELPWAAEILASSDPAESKMKRLYAAGIERASGAKGLLHVE